MFPPAPSSRYTGPATRDTFTCTVSKFWAWSAVADASTVAATMESGYARRRVIGPWWREPDNREGEGDDGRGDREQPAVLAFPATASVCSTMGIHCRSVQ